MSVDGTAGSMRLVVTLSIPPRDTALQTSLVRPGDAETLTWQRFDARSLKGVLHLTRVAWLAMGGLRAGPHRVVHHPRRMSTPSRSDMHFVLQVSGSSVLEQHGRSLTLHPGSWGMLGADLSYTIASREPSERLIIVIGQERLASDIKPATLVGRALSATSGTGRLFFSTAVCLADELPYIRGENAQTLAEQLTSLLDVALRNELALDLVEDNDGRRERVYRYVTRHLREPQLTVERIASDLGWSRRTLARVFEARGETLMEHVYRERLEGIRRDLLDPTLEAHALSDIARSWGFRNYTHFSDRFRAQYGVPPAAFRRRAMTRTMKLVETSEVSQDVGRAQR